jgi:hypothetical protein
MNNTQVFNHHLVFFTLATAFWISRKQDSLASCVLFQDYSVAIWCSSPGNAQLFPRVAPVASSSLSDLSGLPRASTHEWRYGSQDRSNQTTVDYVRMPAVEFSQGRAQVPPQIKHINVLLIHRRCATPPNSLTLRKQSSENVNRNSNRSRFRIFGDIWQIAACYYGGQLP